MEEAAEVYKHLINLLSEIIKKEKEVPNITAPRRRCLYYSKLYSDVTKRWVVSMESKQTNYILHILYTNSKFSIDLPYNSSTDLVPANKYN